MSVDEKLLLLRAVHTGVFVVETAAIAYMIWRGFFGRIGWLCGLCVLLSAGTGMSLVLNEGECIFHTWAEIIAGRDHVSDILLPDSVARLIVPVSIPFVALGYVLLAIKWWRSAARPDA